MPDASLYIVGQRQKRMSINASYNIYYDCMYVSVCTVCICVCTYVFVFIIVCINIYSDFRQCETHNRI